MGYHLVNVRGIPMSIKADIRTHRFEAEGDASALKAHLDQLRGHHRAITQRLLIGYGSAVLFSLIATATIILGPEDRAMAVNIMAAANLLLAAGMAGFTTLRVETVGFKMDATKVEFPRLV